MALYQKTTLKEHLLPGKVVWGVWNSSHLSDASHWALRESSVGPELPFAPRCGHWTVRRNTCILEESLKNKTWSLIGQEMFRTSNLDCSQVARKGQK